ncbi:MAG: LPS assembly lipoprotein LptE [Rhodobacteraceae bacterium]|nr:LPS assembly lipoprotein LptE [Paracoccaceae bacterium]
MSSSDRRRFLALLAASPLVACGFTPAYGPGGPAEGLNGQIAIDDPYDKNAFDLVGRLEERLGRAKPGKWRLSYAITVSSVGLGITSTNAITRYNLLGTVTYTLHRINDGSQATAGKVENFTSYSASGTIVSTTASERDAYERLMRILADQIVTDLIASSAGWAQS